MRDFLEIRSFITPVLLSFLWWFGAAAITVAAFDNMGPYDGYRGLVILIGGNIVWRVSIEAVIVLFRIHDSLRSIEQQGTASRLAATPGFGPRAVEGSR